MEGSQTRTTFLLAPVTHARCIVTSLDIFILYIDKEKHHHCPRCIVLPGLSDYKQLIDGHFALNASNCVFMKGKAIHTLRILQCSSQRTPLDHICKPSR